jgi:hypothetical protein
MDVFPCAVSLAFFDLRKDRDTRTYYSYLLENFAVAYPGRLVVFTNDAGVFSSEMETRELADLEPLLMNIWPEPNWRDIYRSNLAQNPRNSNLLQYQFPDLLLPWFSKISLIQKMLRELPEVIWIDAGLLFSVDHRHSIPEPLPSYDQARITECLPPVLKRGRDANCPILAGIPRTFRLTKVKRPHFHGMSYMDMGRAATGFTASARNDYIVGGAGYWPQSALSVLNHEVRAAWQAIRALERVGTEENILTLLAWKHGWPSLPVTAWCRLLANPPTTTRSSTRQ